VNSAVIVSAVRTAVGKAPKGKLSATRPDDMAAIVMRAAIEQVPGLRPEEVEDIYIGCAMPEAEQGMNVARVAAFRAGLPYTVPAMTLNRFCSSGLQSIAFAADRILSGAANCILAGGTESMSMIPMGGHKIAPNPALIESDPDTYLSMGLTSENLAREFGIRPRSKMRLRWKAIARPLLRSTPDDSRMRSSRCRSAKLYWNSRAERCVNSTSRPTKDRGVTRRWKPCKT